MDTNTFAHFENGTLTVGTKTWDTTTLPWNEHKDFSGVFLKNLITGEQTDGRFTCHLVRIAPNGKIGLHAHPASIELHEVVAGSGMCATESGEIAYTSGSVAVLACNAPHEVRAGKDGLYLFAKFIAVPA